MYMIKVYVKHGYFEYSVSSMASALEHAQAIMECQIYRRSRDDGSVELHHVSKVKIEGEGLMSEYLDTFRRT